MVAVTSSYKTKELILVRRVLKQKVREIEALREKTMHKGERRHEERYLEEEVKMQKEQIHKWKSNHKPEQLKICMRHFDNTKKKVTKSRYEIKSKTSKLNNETLSQRVKKEQFHENRIPIV